MQLRTILAKPKKTKPWTAEESQFLKDNADKLSPEEIAEKLGRNRLGVLSHARRTYGMDLKRTRKRRSDIEPARVEGRERDAARHLQSIAPTFRCDASGSASLKGDHWRFGNIVMTNEQLMARAERAGWRPDAWQEIGL